MYFDESTDRKQAESDARIEAVRAGTIFASNPKAHRKWRSSAKSKPGRGLTGDALETAVMGIAALFPENVVHA